MSCLRLLPPFQEQRDFRFSTDQRCESSCLCHIKATGGTTLTEHVIHVDGLSNASECLCSHPLTVKITLDQAIGRFADGNLRLSRFMVYCAFHHRRHHVWHMYSSPR